jgi:hypothetical protein
MEIQDLILKKYNMNENTEIKNLFFMKNQNENFLDYLKKTLEFYNDTIDLISKQIYIKKQKLNDLHDIFLINNKHFKQIITNITLEI